MSHSNYLALINRGRKAGLNTRDLYSAMATRPAEGADQAPGRVDGNGYTQSYDSQGRRVFRPAAEPRP
jgi:hypothetical protein